MGKHIDAKSNQDISGKTFDRLIALYFSRKIKNRSFWRCKCSCGNEKDINIYSLLNGNAKSCGCLRRETMVKNRQKPTHGKARTKTYRGWLAMLMRCNNPNSTHYHNYGGRGITICDKWLKFEGFYEDMGEKPFKEATLDRIDNNGNYCKENCRWATRKQQCRNKRSNRIIEFNGKSQCLQDWADELGINKHILKERLNAWDVERAFTEKVHYKNKSNPF
jgi:hypothetical protein